MALTATTLSLFNGVNDRYVKLASATGIAPKMLIYCEGEYNRVTDVSQAGVGIVGIVPGYLGMVSIPHENGAPAYYGFPSDFPNEPFGPAFLAVLQSNASASTASAGFATDTYLVGSAVPVPLNGFLSGMRYVCTFDMVKTAAGTATPAAVVRIGTTGTTADAAILTFTFAAGTAAVDTGTFVVTAHFRLSGTAAVLVGTCECRHALAATGLTSTGASGQGQIAVVSSAFDSTRANLFIGVSFNGGASFSGTNTLVEAELKGF
jgi:hypothetical protein